ncbi:hypothetical protein QE109_15040 [Fusibacter bizertensis]|uniref:Uncharacterized protein n=1 Tax=Fusibacter bizertensis TaxID=1488331 RepID=A0ABT6NGF2_9FIRM|nr:hypothetical protein [Fusibacter bizertensis]MDH8679472.1 hypothetical protein [Fusibacter bizertensis]
MPDKVVEKSKLDIDRKKLQEEFLESVESKLRRNEKNIWFIKNEDHPQKESISKSANK